jgi:hypothetical protein
VDVVVLAAGVTGSSSSTAQVATAIATIITALGGLTLAVGVLLPILKSTRSTEKQVAVVHTIVNQQRTDAQRYNIALTQLLLKHGIEVPIDQSLPVIGEPDAQPGQPTG